MAAIDDQLDEMLATATAEDDKIDSIIALLGSLSAPLGLTAEQQAKLDQIKAKLADNPQRIQDAIDANTAPTP